MTEPSHRPPAPGTPASGTPTSGGLSPEDDAALRRAVETLEAPGFFVKAANLVGSPVEKLTRSLPAPVEQALSHTVESALRRAAQLAKTGLGGRWRIFDSTWSHRIEAVVTGAAGGALGLPGLAAELPVTTALILRSILMVAQEHGEDLGSPDVTDECLKVFAFGPPGRGSGEPSGGGAGAVAGPGGGGRDKGTDSAYFATRAAIPRVAAHAADTIPKIAARYAIPVSEKLAAQAAPIVGAVGGASLNLLFIAHYQGIAQAHFTVRRLERLHGPEAVRARYQHHLAELRAE